VGRGGGEKRKQEPGRKGNYGPSGGVVLHLNLRPQREGRIQSPQGGEEKTFTRKRGEPLKSAAKGEIEFVVVFGIFREPEANTAKESARNLKGKTTRTTLLIKKSPPDLKEVRRRQGILPRVSLGCQRTRIAAPTTEHCIGKRGLNVRRLTEKYGSEGPMHPGYS